jgi:glycosyltransferase involved in cell wall biosynthesis
MLVQLASRGCDVEILGATVFDAGAGPEDVAAKLEGVAPLEIVHLPDGSLTHKLVKTSDPRSLNMRLSELDKLFSLFLHRLEEWRPDIVFLYGGRPPDLLVLSEAKRRGASTAFYLVNANYRGKRWHQDVDLVLTDSRATADHYAEKLGIWPQPIGKFIRKEDVCASRHTRKRMTFINPKPEKGAYLVAQIALAMEKTRPDILFEVVESRGRWQESLERVSATQGSKRKTLSNVVVTPNTSDMRPVYGRSRAVLVPSLWWESGSRVVAEAMLNGVPGLVTNRGGLPELLGDGGVIVTLPEVYHKKPYSKLLPQDALAALTRTIEQFYDNEEGYQSMVREAVKAGRELHDIEQNTDRLLELFSSLVPQPHTG